VNIYARAAEHRARLIALDEATRAGIRTDYRDVEEAILAGVRDLLKRRDEALKRGESMGGWLYQSQRLETLLGDARARLAAFGDRSAARTARGQRRAAEAAESNSGQLLLDIKDGPSVQGGFNALPSGAIEALMGHLADGSPLVQHFARLAQDGPVDAPTALARLRKALLVGVALGQAPRQVAQSAASALDVSRAQAERIARTEVLRAYRESSRLSYAENADVVQGWIWHSARSARSCAACIAMDGKTFPLDEPMGSHPGCRCTMLPWLRIDAAPTNTGEAWLREQDDVTQAEVLGHGRPDFAAARAFREGKVSLDDFVEMREDPAWGTTRTARSLKNVLAGMEQRKATALPDPPTSGGFDDLSAQLFGTRRVQVRVASDVAAISDDLFGRSLSPMEWAELVGAPDEAQVSVTTGEYHGYDAVMVQTSHPMYDGAQIRYVFRGDEGIEVYNAIFRVNRSSPRGVALRVLARQVRQAQRLDVQQLLVHAAGHPGNPRWNGYYTWARYGYDWELESETIAQLEGTVFEGATHVSDLMVSEEGAAWWKDNGTEGHGWFDLRSGSLSVRLLEGYMERSGVKPYGD
jgi:SPP1 gp7 family putative phage head morphogenesis protein